MPTTGLRGSGFNTANPLQFEQFRENREMRAEQILQQREERLQKEKEREKKEKEADRLLKEDFDKAKTEAVLLGLGKGRAESMSLGNLKGWTEAQRKIKVNQIDMMNIKVQNQKLKETRKAEQKARRAEVDDARATQMMRDPKFDLTNIPKSLQENREKMTLGSMKSLLGMASQMPKQITPLSQWPHRDFDGDDIPDMVQNPNSGAGHQIGGGSSGSKFQQFDPNRNIYDTSSGAPKLVAPAQNPPKAVQPEEYQRYKKILDDLIQQSLKPMPKDMKLSDRLIWDQNRQTTLQNITQLRQLINGMDVARPQAPAQAPAQPQSSGINPADYIDMQTGQRTQKYQDEITSRQEKEDLIRELKQQGVNPRILLDLMKSGRYPLRK